jgi:pyridoxal phosphate enzyme (YggS family)
VFERANLDAVERRVAAACAKAGRPRESVTLVAVSKLHPAAAIREAHAAGLRHFGENYAQELRDKHAELAALPGLVWHAIGPVQPKNAKYVARAATVFHALDRLETAQELSRRREGPALRCLIEVNVAGEASKAGLAPARLPEFIAAVRALPNLELVGLTTMPPLHDSPEASRPYFRQLAALAKAHGLHELSMGTTGDFEVGIEEGATLVRVGTALFGERPTPRGA